MADKVPALRSRKASLGIRGAFLGVFVGKRRWKRERLADLANDQEHERLLKLMDQAKGQAEGEYSQDLIAISEKFLAGELTGDEYHEGLAILRDRKTERR